MASIFGEDGGTLAGGRRRPTNAGYRPAVPNPGTGTGTETRPNGDTTFGGNTNAAGSDGSGSGSGSPTPPPPSYNTGWLSGYDPGKLLDPNNGSYAHAKYAIGRTLSQFDPHGGFSPEVLAALNALGYGMFSGSGDALSLNGITTAGQAAGLDPHNFTGDFIQGFHSDHPVWTYDAYADPATAAAPPPAGGTPGAPGATSGADSFSALMAMLAGLTRQPAAATPPPAAPAPPPATSGPPPPTNAPSFSGGYTTPGYGSVGNATQSMALRLSQILSDPRYANDPFVQQILRMVGGGQ
jgi:hypothetical protein